MKLATIGYENDTQPQMIARLKDAGVETVIDVRAVASSRKAGFSKSLLAASLAEAGIGYYHLRDLGTRSILRASRSKATRKALATPHGLPVVGSSIQWIRPRPPALTSLTPVRISKRSPARGQSR